MFYQLLVGLTIPNGFSMIPFSNVPRLLLFNFLDAIPHYAHEPPKKMNKLDGLLTIAEQAKRLPPEQLRGLAQQFEAPLDNPKNLAAKISGAPSDTNWRLWHEYIPASPSPAATALAIFAVAEKEERIPEFVEALSRLTSLQAALAAA